MTKQQLELPLFLSENELMQVCLTEYHQINEKFFNNKLPIPKIEFSTRMRTTAGKCYPKRKCIRLNIDHYRKDGLAEFLKTFRHECIHLLIPNHGPEFKKYAQQMDVDVYWDSAPTRRSKPWKYWSICPVCGLGVSKKVKRSTVTYCPSCKRKQGILVETYYRKITISEKKKYGLDKK